MYDLCREALRSNRPLLDLLAGHPEISRHLDREALARLCDPAHYLGQAGVMVDRVLAMRHAGSRRHDQPGRDKSSQARARGASATRIGTAGDDKA